MNVHYNVETGQIMAYGSATEEDGADSYLPGCKVLLLDEMRAIDARTQRVDPVARAIIDKAEPDPEPDALPLVRDAVRAELAASDKFMMPDYPISEADRAAWARYRKALRDASKGNDTAAAMLAAIPARPDGSTLTLSPEVTT